MGGCSREDWTTGMISQRELSLLLDPLRHLKHKIHAFLYDTRYLVLQTYDQYSAVLTARSSQEDETTILSSDLNPTYAFYTPLTVLFWNQICRLSPVLLAIGDDGEWSNDPFGG